QLSKPSALPQRPNLRPGRYSTRAAAPGQVTCSKSLRLAKNVEIEIFALRQSWKHTAVEHLVDDGSRYSPEEFLAHLRIVVQHLYQFLLHRCFRLAFVLPQLLARRHLIFLDDFVG